MKQESFSDMEYRSRKKKTKREEFLEIMDEIIPWEEWVSLVVPHYPTGKRGRPPIEIESLTIIWPVRLPIKSQRKNRQFSIRYFTPRILLSALPPAGHPPYRKSSPFFFGNHPIIRRQVLCSRLPPGAGGFPFCMQNAALR